VEGGGGRARSGIGADARRVAPSCQRFIIARADLVPTWLDLNNNDKQAAARIATPYSSYTFPIR